MLYSQRFGGAAKKNFMSKELPPLKKKSKNNFLEESSLHAKQFTSGVKFLDFLESEPNQKSTKKFKFVNDPTAGSPTVTLLRLLLPLNDQV
jgi:hypothetical protein